MIYDSIHTLTKFKKPHRVYKHITAALTDIDIDILLNAWRNWITIKMCAGD